MSANVLDTQVSSSEWTQLLYAADKVFIQNKHRAYNLKIYFGATADAADSGFILLAPLNDPVEFDLGYGDKIWGRLEAEIAASGLAAVMQVGTLSGPAATPAGNNPGVGLLLL